MTLEELLSLKRAEAAAAGLPELREVKPSLRDFAYYCGTSREELAVVPLLAARMPAAGELWPGLDVAGASRRIAAGSAHALAVATDRRFGGRPGDLAAASAAGEVPVLRYDFLLGVQDLYVSRALGADAVWIHAFLHPAESLAEMMAVAASLHLEVVIGVRDRLELAKALAARTRFVGVHADDLLGGEIDLPAATRLAVRAAESASAVIFGGVSTESELAALHGVVDAVVCPAPLAARQDLDAIIDRVNA